MAYSHYTISGIKPHKGAIEMEKWLLAYRKEKGYTQKNISETVGIDRTHYAKIESGQRRPSPEIAKKIAKALGFDWQLFYPDNENSA